VYYHLFERIVPEKLQEVLGIGRQIAQQIYDYFHPPDQDKIDSAAIP
jgi:NAD-dependent DNA ligase